MCWAVLRQITKLAGKSYLTASVWSCVWEEYLWMEGLGFWDTSKMELVLSGFYRLTNHSFNSLHRCALASCASCCLLISLTSHILLDQFHFSFLEKHPKQRRTNMIRVQQIFQKYIQSNVTDDSMFESKLDKMYSSPQTEINVLEHLPCWHVVKILHLSNKTAAASTTQTQQGTRPWFIYGN